MGPDQPQLDTQKPATGPACRICELPPAQRDSIDTALGMGVSLKQAARLASSLATGRAVNVATVKRHLRDHVSIWVYSQRQTIERRAQNLPPGRDSILTPAAYAETMMTSAMAAMANGTAPVTARDGLAAAKTLHDIETAAAQGEDLADMAAQLERIITAVRAVCTAEQMTEITRIIQRG